MSDIKTATRKESVDRLLCWKFITDHKSDWRYCYNTSLQRTFRAYGFFMSEEILSIYSQTLVLWWWWLKDSSTSYWKKRRSGVSKEDSVLICLSVALTCRSLSLSVCLSCLDNRLQNSDESSQQPEENVEEKVVGTKEQERREERRWAGGDQEEEESLLLQR